MASFADYRHVLLPLLAVCTVVLVLAGESVASMVALWELSSYQHAWLIPPISAYLVWSDRTRLNDVSVQPSPVGAAVFLGCVWIWMVSRMTLVQAAEHVSLWAMLNAAAWTVLGWPAYRRLLIPLLFLFLALPVGTSLVPVLMEITASIAQSLLHAAGIPALREGMFFTLTGGNFVVADVCSGYRYFTAGLTITTLFSIFMFRSLRKAALYVAFSAVFFVLINGVRAAIVMAVASATNMRHFAGMDHVYFGWVLFLIGMVACYFVGWRFADASEEEYAR